MINIKVKLSKSDAETINEAFKYYLESQEGFSGLTDEDMIQDAWFEACDYAASASVLPASLFEKFLVISEENLREACWDTFVENFQNIRAR